jgi:hypothetical protein
LLPIGEGSTAAQNPGEYSLVPEHALHSGKAVVDAFIWPGTEESDLVMADGVDDFRNDPNGTHTGPQPGVDLAAALQLPADTIDDVRRGEGSRVQPAAFGVVAEFRLDFDAEGRTYELFCDQSLHEVVGRCPHTERHLVDPIEGWFEGDHRIEFVWWLVRGDGPRVEPSGESVQVCAVGSESAEYVGGR